MAGKRSTRVHEFESKPSWLGSSLSCDLVFSAGTLLALALRSRRGRVYRLATTHYSPHATGATALVVTAFDTFLNEVYDWSSNLLPWARKFAAEASVLAKHRGLLHSATPAGATFDTADLETLMDVRHEIVHYLPRPTPTLIHRLERRGILMSTSQPSGWDMGQKLASYALAYWAFETIEAAVAQLVDVMPAERAFTLSLAENFTLYRQSACHPEELRWFDQEHGLRPTEESA
jgi:hypothetical protein